MQSSKTVDIAYVMFHLYIDSVLNYSLKLSYILSFSKYILDLQSNRFRCNIAFTLFFIFHFSSNGSTLKSGLCLASFNDFSM